MEFTHKPVLLAECIEALHIRPEGIYVDGTLGRAGHSREIAQRLTTGRLVCIDRDQAAIDAAQERLTPWMDRVTLVHSNFDRVSEILAELDIPGVDGMLFDLGVSSPQLDDASRGFSYMHDAPLDMRMDATAPLTAYDVVNTWSYEELRHILFEYGEERYAPAIAKRIVQARETAPVQTTLELAELIRSAMPAAALREKQHPAKRSFQAIRIAVNHDKIIVTGHRRHGLLQPVFLAGLGEFLLCASQHNISRYNIIAALRVLDGVLDAGRPLHNLINRLDIIVLCSAGRREISLRIEVNPQNPVPLRCQSCSQCLGRGCFADTALLICYCNNHVLTLLFL